MSTPDNSSDAILIDHQATAERDARDHAQRLRSVGVEPPEPLGRPSEGFPGLEPHPNCRSAVTEVDLERARAAQRQRWRHLWLREIDASTGSELDEIGGELMLRRRPAFGGDADYRKALKAQSQRLLEETAEETPDDAHRIDPLEAELSALRIGCEQLDRLDAPARARVLAWLLDKYGGGALR